MNCDLQSRPTVSSSNRLQDCFCSKIQTRKYCTVTVLYYDGAPAAAAGVFFIMITAVVVVEDTWGRRCYCCCFYYVHWWRSGTGGGTSSTTVPLGTGGTDVLVLVPVWCTGTSSK